MVSFLSQLSHNPEELNAPINTASEPASNAAVFRPRASLRLGKDQYLAVKPAQRRQNNSKTQVDQCKFPMFSTALCKLYVTL